MISITLEYDEALQPLLYDAFWKLHGDPMVDDPTQGQKLNVCLLVVREFILEQIGKYQRAENVRDAINQSNAAVAQLKQAARARIRILKEGTALEIDDRRRGNNG